MKNDKFRIPVTEQYMYFSVKGDGKWKKKEITRSAGDDLT